MGGREQIRKELFIVDEEQKHVQFAKTFLVGWDNSLSNQQVRVCVGGCSIEQHPGFPPGSHDSLYGLRSCHRR